MNRSLCSLSTLIATLAGCHVMKQEVVVTPVPLSELPKDVSAIISRSKPDFVPGEVQKKVRGGRTYYDVEGESGGNEMEFDVLMAAEGPRIVEIQRDLTWARVPKGVRTTYSRETKAAEPVRIIESVQTDESIIYEFFLKGKPAEPSYEIRTAKGSTPELLKVRAEH